MVSSTSLMADHLARLLLGRPHRRVSPTLIKQAVYACYARAIDKIKGLSP